ncbi:50S ribosomal protein L22 [Candidatus Kaiserbacteria bacterium]|nr:50S ribosomal protein L22 [Candidatus Kaiserbacteria bacterium]
MKALLKNYHQSPRKVRLVADMIRGKSIEDARVKLAFLAKKSSPAMLKLLESAIANARSSGKSADGLFVKTVTVNKGAVSRRFMPKARGRAARYAKTMSIVALELGSVQKVENSGQKTAKKATARKSESQKLGTAN